MKTKHMIVAIIQARMGSTRLPGKVLKKICGKTLLGHLLIRVKRVRRLDKIIVATTISKEDEPIVALGESLGVEVYRGSEEDVLQRYYEAAKSAGAKVVVRLTGDCPLLDPNVVDRVVGFYLKHRVHYVSNVNPPTFPDGMDVEVFSFATLERTWREAHKISEREHVTPYIRSSGKFRTANVVNSTDMSGLRLTIDQKEDVKLVKKLIDFFVRQGKPDFGLKEITNLWRRNPRFFSDNQKIQRNEGYLQSVQKDIAVRSPDVIAVLGGGLVKEKGGWRTTNFEEPNSRFALGDRLRVVAAATLFNELRETSPDILVWVSGGKGKLAGIPGAPTVASIMKSELEIMRVPPNVIQTEEHSSTTHDQLIRLNALIQEKKVKHIKLISNQYHLPRIQAMIEKGPGIEHLKNSLQDGRTVLLSAEDVLIVKKKWQNVIRHAYESPTMKERIASEAVGVREVLQGTYVYNSDPRPAVALRRATLRDARFLYSLRNEKVVRKASFTNNSFSFPSHLLWLKKKLDGKESILFIAVAKGKRVGQVRFDVAHDAGAEVSVAIANSHRGKGYGALLLLEASRQFLEEYSSVKKIHAFIKKDNIPSLRIFKNAGYKDRGETIYKDQHAVEMVLLC